MYAEEIKVGAEDELLYGNYIPDSVSIPVYDAIGICVENKEDSIYFKNHYDAFRKVTIFEDLEYISKYELIDIKTYLIFLIDSLTIQIL